MKNTLTAVAVIAILSGCASPATVYDPSVPEPQVVVNSLDTRYWEAVSKQAPRFPRSNLSRGKSGCVNVSYIITSEGRVANAVVLKALPDKTFDRVSIEAVSQFVYRPSETNTSKEPVRTNNIFTYIVGNMPQETHQQLDAMWRSRCSVVGEQ